MKEAQLRNGRSRKIGKSAKTKTNSRKLTNRTKLNPIQLKRAKGSAGRGESSVYKADGTMSLELVRRLHLAKKRAKQFVLFTDELGRRLYVGDFNLIDFSKAEKENENLAVITFSKAEALPFYEGFDKPEMKIEYYNQKLKLKLLTQFI